MRRAWSIRARRRQRAGSFGEGGCSTFASRKKQFADFEGIRRATNTSSTERRFMSQPDRDVHGILLVRQAARPELESGIAGRAPTLFGAAKAGHTGSLDPLGDRPPADLFWRGDQDCRLAARFAQGLRVPSAGSARRPTPTMRRARRAKRPVPVLDDATIRAALAPLTGPHHAGAAGLFGDQARRRARCTGARVAAKWSIRRRARSMYAGSSCSKVARRLLRLARRMRIRNLRAQPRARSRRAARLRCACRRRCGGSGSSRSCEPRMHDAR